MAQETSQAEAATSITETAGGNDAAARSAEEATTAAAAATAPGITDDITAEDDGPQPRLNEVVDVESYEKVRRDALRPKAQAKQPPEQSAAPAAGETPASALPAATAAEPDDDTELDPDDKGPDRIRLSRLKDPLEKKRVAMAVQLASDEGIPVREALARISGEPSANGTNGTTAEATTAAAEPPPNLRTLEQIQAEQEALDADYDAAADTMDTKKMAELRKQERALNREAEEVKQATTRAAQQFEAQADASGNEAASYYPDLVIEGTPLRAKAIEIEGRLRTTGNPLLTQADAPLRLAQMAANELGIAPADPAKPKATTAATNGARPSPSTATRPAPLNQAAVIRPTQPAAAPASGAARSTQGNGQGIVAIGKFNSVDDYEQFKEKHLGLRR